MRGLQQALVVAFIAVLGPACGAADSSGDGPGRFGGGNSGSGDGDGAGDGSGAGGAGADDFGNTDNKPPAATDPLFDGGDGVNQTSNPDDVKCGGLKVKPEISMEVVPGNLLLVFDKSGSMNEAWSGTTGRTKWQDALAAIPAALMPLQDQVNAGAVFFPFPDNCGVPPPGSAPHIAFMPGADFLTAWASFSAATPANGGTPLRAALGVADQVLQAQLPTLTGITTVVIVTDGQPNCVNGGGLNDDDTSPNLTPYLANWLALGVKTYVVGLPGVAQAFTLLQDLAAAGGTVNYISADNPMILQDQLKTIITSSVTTNFDSCMIHLDEMPPSLDELHLLVVKDGMENSVDRDLGAAGGWTVDASGQNIVLQGRFCELAKMGEYDEISVVFGCTEAPPLPPPPPPI